MGKTGVKNIIEIKSMTKSRVYDNIYFKTGFYMNKELTNYINNRYERWADYALYHSTKQGMGDQYIDILNEVLIAVLKKDEAYILELYNRKKNGYTELDYLILSMIKTYCTSDTAPYRWNNINRLPIDANIKDMTRVDRIDEDEYDRDKASEIYQKMNQVRYVFDRLALTDLERNIFSFKFFEGNKFSEWEYPKINKNQLYIIYKTVLATIIIILSNNGETKLQPQLNRTNIKRCEMLVDIYEICHSRPLKHSKV